MTGFWDFFRCDAWAKHMWSGLDEAMLDRLHLELLAELKSESNIYPPGSQIFRAFQLVRPEQVKVVIVGQDPYHGQGQADGLAFSCTGAKMPPSLRNILAEVEADTGQPSICANGDLTRWANQGVLLLNSLLTVREGEPLSHQKLGWEKFTDVALTVAQKCAQVAVFMLWGAAAQKKRDLIDAGRHLILETSHPSPLSCYRGFNGSRQFSQANEFMQSKGFSPIHW